MSNEDEGSVSIPDMVDDDGSIERVYCFLDLTRACNASCMAYSTHASPNKGLPDVQRHCLVLNNVERTGRHLTIIASQLAELEKSGRRRDADRKRESNTPRGNPNPGPFAQDPFKP